MDDLFEASRKHWKKIVNLTEELNKVYVILLLLLGVVLYFRDKLLQPLTSLALTYWQFIVALIAGVTIVYVLLQVQFCSSLSLNLISHLSASLLEE